MTILSILILLYFTINIILANDMVFFETLEEKGSPTIMGQPVWVQYLITLFIGFSFLIIFINKRIISYLKINKQAD